MPVQYEKTNGQGHKYQVPDYPEAADGPKAFKDYSDFLDLILPPVGTVLPYVGATAPSGWLLCDGSTVSSTTYPKLSALCGTKFGTATTGNFILPNLKGRVIAGVDSSQSEFDTLGETGGTKTSALSATNLPAHAHSTPDHTHSGSLSGASAASSGDHGHTITSSINAQTGAHTHYYIQSAYASVDLVSGSIVPILYDPDYNTNTGSSTTSSAGDHSHTVSSSAANGGSHTHSVSGTVSISSGGGGTSGTGTGLNGTAFSIMPPYMAMNYIIRAA